MKKLERSKTFQLIIFFVIAAICVYIVIINSDTYAQIVESKELQILTALLWIILFVSFVFIFLDFTMFARQKSDYNALDYAVHSDPLAKIANRQGCDEIIEKYLDEALPDGMGAVMFLLTSLNDINRYHNRLLGNKQIRNFSIILKLASTNVCFVGRNGGNVFMAIFEENADDNMEIFLSRVEEKVVEFNKENETLPMYYSLGTALKSQEPESSITGLISKASKRAYDSAIHPEGIVTIADMAEDGNTTVHRAEILSREEADIIEETPVAEEEIKEDEIFALPKIEIPSFAIAAKIINVATAAVNPITASQEVPVKDDDSLGYAYTEDEKYGPRSEDEAYITVSYREAI